jgi:hypothetical protein
MTPSAADRLVLTSYWLLFVIAPALASFLLLDPSVTSSGIAFGVGFILVLIGERGIRHWNRLFPSDLGPPPPPDVAQQPAFPGQRIVETVYSESKQGRVFITEDESGIYRIMVQWWDTSDWKEWGQAFWSPAGSSSHTDNLQRARELADEALKFSQDEG